MAREYLISAPDYRHESAGIRVLHLLADALMAKGHKAYPMYAKSMPGAKATGLWDAYVIAEKIADGAVVIYPEIVPGNPLGAEHVARWVLNKPGLLGGEAIYDPDEKVFLYTTTLTGSVKNDISGYLCCPSIDTDLFVDDGRKKLHDTFYVGKGKHDGKLDTSGMQEITKSPAWPQNREVVAEVLKNTDTFYSFDNFTAMVTEANLCGAVSVIIPDGVVTRESLETSEMGLDGIAWGTDEAEMERAHDTLKDVPARYKALEAKFDAQLDHFIEVTQGMA
jgi:O-antigen biosynthesis protein